MNGIIGPALQSAKRMIKDLQIGDKEVVREIDTVSCGIHFTQEEKELGFSRVQVLM